MAARRIPTALEHEYEGVLGRYLVARSRFDRETAKFEATEIGRSVVLAGCTKDDAFDLHMRAQRRTERRLAADPSEVARSQHRKLARGADKPLMLALMVHHDLQELARAEQRWRDSDARQQSVLDSMTDPMVLLDAQGCIAACNAAWRRAGLVEGRDGREVGGDCLGALEQAGLRSVAGGVVRVLRDHEQYEERCVRQVGSELRSFHFRAAPLITRMGGAVLMQIDVTRQTRFENSLHEADKLQATATLAAGIAHDFNNLLGSIIGLTELCQMEAPDGSQLSRNLGRVMQASGKAQALVRSMLDFSRQTPSAKQRIRAARFLAEIEPLLKAVMPASVELYLEAHGDFEITVDVRQMEQVLFNLVNNAVHALRGRTGRVTVRAECLMVRPNSAMACGLSGSCTCITVADTGEGIPNEVIDRIFDPFFTTKPVGEGTGLGLAAVHGIVRNHGGCVEVSSVPGEGTVFSLFLPAASEAGTDTDWNLEHRGAMAVRDARAESPRATSVS